VAAVISNKEYGMTSSVVGLLAINN